MAYATVDGMLTRYKPLGTMIGTGSLDVNTTDIASIFIADSESFMNAFLSARYVVPVQPEPLITQLCSDIAIYKILEDKAPRIPDFMAKRYTNAMSMLMMLATGAIGLTSSNQIVSSAGDEEAWSNVLENPISGGPIFTPVEAMSRYITRSGNWNCW